MQRKSLRNRKVLDTPLWVICLCGFVGVLIDIDHPLSLKLFPKEPYPAKAKFLHTPMLIVSSVVGVAILAYLGRLYHRALLSWHE